MSKQKRVSHPIYSLLPTDVDGFDSLAELALDMRWSRKKIRRITCANWCRMLLRKAPG
jgi:hypothetical protein